MLVLKSKAYTPLHCTHSSRFIKCKNIKRFVYDSLAEISDISIMQQVFNSCEVKINVESSKKMYMYFRLRL